MVVALKAVPGKNSVQIFTLKSGNKTELVSGDYPKATDIAVSPDGKLITIAEKTEEQEPITSSIRILHADDGE
jgi:hypothetical protein